MIGNLQVQEKSLLLSRKYLQQSPYEDPEYYLEKKCVKYNIIYFGKKGTEVKLDCI